MPLTAPHADQQRKNDPARARDFTVMHVDRVRDGRIVEHRGIGDINTMGTQLGVVPPTVS